jgi:hypothetical protein
VYLSYRVSCQVARIVHSEASIGALHIARLAIARASCSGVYFKTVDTYPYSNNTPTPSIFKRHVALSRGRPRRAEVSHPLLEPYIHQCSPT